MKSEVGHKSHYHDRHHLYRHHVVFVEWDQGSICNQELRCLFQLLIHGEDDPGTGREKNKKKDNDIDKGGSIAVMILGAMSR